MSFISKLKNARSGKTPQCSAVIAAAGDSKRMNGRDKLFIEILGRPVIAHTLAVFQSCRLIDEIIIVSREDHIVSIGDICSRFNITKATKVILGGSTRLLSVLNGVYAVSKDAGLIAIHDGARPCVDAGTIERAIEAGAKSHASAPAVPVSSTIKKVERGYIVETVPRDKLFEIQTPQVFAADLIKAALTNAYSKSIDVTDDCEAVELIGAPVRVIDGSHSNIKLTTNEDIIIAEAILGASAKISRLLTPADGAT